MCDRALIRGIQTPGCELLKATLMCTGDSQKAPDAFNSHMTPCFCCCTGEPTHIHHLKREASKAWTTLKNKYGDPESRRRSGPEPAIFRDRQSRKSLIQLADQDDSACRRLHHPTPPENISGEEVKYPEVDCWIMGHPWSIILFCSFGLFCIT
ncbi:uncharacterized protein LOC144313604 isoform X3 [Canis aureus]